MSKFLNHLNNLLGSMSIRNEEAQLIADGYSKLSDSKKAWIDGSKCNGVKFQDLPNNEITFGHIIPQSWGTEYPHILKTIHHPDNLYLTCKSCNSSLNSNFPQTELKNKISKREGTIGDWLRTHIRDFES